MSTKRVYILTRTRADGVVHVVEVPNLREARKRVAWCMDYNANQSRHEACVVSAQLEIGEPLTAHGYAFELVSA